MQCEKRHQRKNLVGKTYSIFSILYKCNNHIYMKTTIDIVSLAKTGADLVVDASSKTTMDLRAIINAVVKSGGHITLKNCDKKTTSDMLSLCKISPKHITIDFS